MCRGCSQGLLVTTDPDTPFLHVGMNAPREEREGGWIQRSWGVGVQNMAREYLPRSVARRASGDGLLRLQVRTSCSCMAPLVIDLPVSLELGPAHR